MWESTIDWVAILREGLKWAKKQEIWEKLVEALAKRHQILVLGASGVGKTQFCDSMLDPGAPSRGTSDRSERVERRKAKAARKALLLIDTPGHVLHRPKRRPELLKAFQGRLDGIINVTCFGYHERQLDDKRRAVPARGPRVATAKYLAASKAEELMLLREWVPHVDSSACPWLLTVVTKADLWWPDKTEVLNYYESGRYAKRLEHLRRIHSVLPYCATIRPFLGGRTSGEFGDEHKEALRGRLVEFLGRKVGDRD